MIQPRRLYAFLLGNSKYEVLTPITTERNFTALIDPSDGQKKSYRIKAFDGLRGVAALSVAIYHYLCLIHPTWVADMASEPKPVVDTPLYFFWNGAFAVALFFVLSGYVIAAAAERRTVGFISMALTRYLRLTVPAAASCLLAWFLLSLFPNATQVLASSIDQPSRWLQFTYQNYTGSVGDVLREGFLDIYSFGKSRLNNVLWTMRIELFGSVGLFLIYGIFSGRYRVLALIVASLLLPPITEPSYLAFGLGALVFEAHRNGLLDKFLNRSIFPVILLVAAIALSFPGDGAHTRSDLPWIQEDLQWGEHRGFLHVIGATLLILSTLYINVLRTFLDRPTLVWLGQISFSLYLVHVPILYTIVAYARIETTLHSSVIFACFLAGSTAIAVIFERTVDLPLLKVLPRIRRIVNNLVGNVASNFFRKS